MPEVERDLTVCAKCGKTGVKGNCAKCQAVAYCSRECQRADWVRHKRHCMPVIVKEIPSKGRGLVASKDIKKVDYKLRGGTAYLYLIREPVKK